MECSVKSKEKYGKTYAACFLGIANQAVVTNITAVLFVPFMLLYGFKFWQLGVLAGINFASQIVADCIMTAIIDKVPFRPILIVASALSAAGLVFYGLTPFIFPVRHIYAGIIAATTVFAFSSGMCEVALSPIIDNIPDSKNKNTAMSLFHSFYAWGQVLCIVITSVYLLILKAENWNYILFFWAVMPIAALIFSLTAPLHKRAAEKSAKDVRKTLFSPFYIIALLAILCGAASEVFMNQWASTFIYNLGLGKAAADLLGMCMFAVFLGIGRLLYAAFGNKINVNIALMFGSLFTAVLFIMTGVINNPVLNVVFCMLCGFTTSLLWPGTLVAASKKFPQAGAWMFAALAIAGDIGAGVSPAAAGFIADAAGFNLTFFIISIFPIIALLCHLYLFKNRRSEAAAPLDIEN